jgi:hypothetical protein
LNHSESQNKYIEEDKNLRITLNLELDDLSQIVDEKKMIKSYRRMKNNKVHSELRIESPKGNSSKGS